MPSESRHLAAAESNELLAVSLIAVQKSYPWAIVLAFYSALHWVDSFLARSAIHPENHSQRAVYVRNTQLRTVFDPYRTLSDRSQDARYELRRFTEAEAREVISSELGAVKRHVQRLLAR